MIVEAIKRAIEERGVKVQLLHDYELVGVSRADAANCAKHAGSSLRSRVTSKRDSGSMSALRIRKRRKNGSGKDDRICTTRCTRRKPRCPIA